MTDHSRQAVRVSVADGVALLQLDRPGSANAIDLATLGEIQAALDDFERSASIRCLVITGAGRVFSAGGDIAEMRRLTVEEGERFVVAGQAAMERLATTRLVVVAALNGHTLGGGLELALACDLRIADERASVGFPEVGLGLIPGWGGTQRAARLLGHSRASLLVLTGDRLTAADAQAIGLIDRVVAAGSALPDAEDLARRIARNSPAALAASKRALVAAQRTQFEAGIVEERAAWLSAFSSTDRIEGLSAFLERRPPRWTNS